MYLCDQQVKLAWIRCCCYWWWAECKIKRKRMQVRILMWEHEVNPWISWSKHHMVPLFPHKGQVSMYACLNYLEFNTRITWQGVANQSFLVWWCRCLPLWFLHTPLSLVHCSPSWAQATRCNVHLSVDITWLVLTRVSLLSLKCSVTMTSHQSLTLLADKFLQLCWL